MVSEELQGSKSKTPKRAAIIAVSAAICLGAASGCGRAESDAVAVTPEPAAAAQPILQVLEPRAQLMPGMGAVYLRIQNSGGQADRLMSIETPIASVVETHESLEEDGVMRMVARPEGFEIPPGGAVDLVPGGKHAMLIDPQAPADSQTIPLTLHFATSTSIDIEASILTMEAMGHDTMDHDTTDHGTTDH